MTTSVWCKEHHALYGNLCHMRDCHRPLVAGTKCCDLTVHQEAWRTHTRRFGSRSLPTVRRLIREDRSDNREWSQHGQQLRIQPQHDDDVDVAHRLRPNYFFPSRFYCLELMVNPCGVPEAWALFDGSESPTAIINFIQEHHPEPHQKAQYYCIDKACRVLRTLVASGRWDMWKITSRIIVDSYHYINHRATDFLCRTWCNPAPLDGTAPNLVRTTRTDDRIEHSRAFNTQASIKPFVLSLHLCCLRPVNSSTPGCLVFNPC